MTRELSTDVASGNSACAKRYAAHLASRWHCWLSEIRVLPYVIIAIVCPSAIFTLGVSIGTIQTDGYLAVLCFLVFLIIAALFFGRECQKYADIRNMIDCLLCAMHYDVAYVSHMFFSKPLPMRCVRMRPAYHILALLCMQHLDVSLVREERFLQHFDPLYMHAKPAALLTLLKTHQEELLIDMQRLLRETMIYKIVQHRLVWCFSISMAIAIVVAYYIITMLALR